MNALSFQDTYLIVWGCLALGINSILNAWLIHTSRGNSIQYVVLFRVVGSKILALPCIVFLNLNYAIIRENQFIQTIWISLILSLSCWLFNKIRTRTQSDIKNYGYLFHDSGYRGFNFYEIFSWIIYLLPYEFLFRGMLLPYQIANHNLIVAVLVNSGLYGLAHIQQGVREAIGAFIFGSLLCFVAIVTGNFWSAFLVHLAFALSNSFITRSNHQYGKVKI